MLGQGGVHPCQQPAWTIATSLTRFRSLSPRVLLLLVLYCSDSINLLALFVSDPVVILHLFASCRISHVDRCWCGQDRTKVRGAVFSCCEWPAIWEQASRLLYGNDLVRGERSGTMDVIVGVQSWNSFSQESVIAAGIVLISASSAGAWPQ